MATYYGTYGQKVQYLASDPSDPQIGQVWYNSTSAVLKVRQDIATNAWASGGSLNTPRTAAAGSGTQTAGLTFGGAANNPTVTTGATELYNGTSWTTSPGTMPTVMYRHSGCGTQTASLGFAGYNTPYPGNWYTLTQVWNGSTWSTPPANMNTTRADAVGFGTQTAAICAAGQGPISTSYALQSATESYNGTSWTSVNSTNTARCNLGGFGVQTAAIIMGGDIYPVNPGARYITNTESWNGTSWTNNPTGLPIGIGQMSGAGTQTAGLGFCGYDIPGARLATTLLWNGTTWSPTSNMATARSYAAPSGTQTAALGSGGRTPSVVSNSIVEEWTGTQTLSRTVTVS
jgi:hypothetical protein